MLVFFLVARRRDVTRLAGQRFEHALHDLDDVRLALAQVLVLDALELIDQLFGLLGHRPLGIAFARGDQLARHLGQCAVAQDHQMQIQESFELAGAALAGMCSASAASLGPCGG